MSDLPKLHVSQADEEGLVLISETAIRAQKAYQLGMAVFNRQATPEMTENLKSTADKLIASIKGWSSIIPANEPATS